MRRWRQSLGAVLVVAALGGCGIEAMPDEARRDRTVERGDEPWRGILLHPGSVLPATVAIDGTPTLPPSAPAYVVRQPTLDDLRDLAERHAGGPVEPGVMPGASPDLVGFATGDGWFLAHEGTFASGGAGASGATWSWADRAWRERPFDEAPSWNPDPCPPATPVPDASEFFAELGLAVVATGRLECAGPVVTAQVEAVIDGTLVVGMGGLVTADETGTIVEVSMPWLPVAPLGDLELAPVDEVLQRLARGSHPVWVAGGCPDPCALTTRAASISLAPVVNGGIGGHDHTVTNLVPGVVQTILLPALWARPIVDAPPAEAVGGQAALAVSSALLVDDPAEAETARDVDAAATMPTGPVQAACASREPWRLGICASHPTIAAGQPLLITVSGEVNDPVGATECSPLLEVEMGDGVTVTPPPPRAGTLVTSRFVHWYAEPGVYTVTAHRASRCTVTAEPGGTEPEYDETTQIEILVQDAST